MPRRGPVPADRGRRRRHDEPHDTDEPDDSHASVSAAVGEAIAAGDLDAFDRLMSPELAAEFRQSITEIKAAFPDYAGTDELYVVEGDRVVSRWTYHGTHLGEWMGVPATGRRVTFTGISVDRVVDGRIVESIVEMDMLGVLQQIGAPGVPAG